MVTDPQTLTQVIAPYIPLLTPATILVIAWKAARLITQIEDRAIAAESKTNEMYTVLTNHIPHALEDVKEEVHGLREDMKLMFQARTAIDSATHKEV